MARSSHACVPDPVISGAQGIAIPKISCRPCQSQRRRGAGAQLCFTPHAPRPALPSALAEPANAESPVAALRGGALTAARKTSGQEALSYVLRQHRPALLSTAAANGPKVDGLSGSNWPLTDPYAARTALQDLMSSAWPQLMEPPQSLQGAARTIPPLA